MSGGGEEGPVDGLHAALVRRAQLGDEDADDGGDHTDGRDDEREDEALLAEGGLAEDQRGDQHHGVRLEQVGGHAGAVADVVAHVVRDGRGVARVVLGDALLDLADEVGADVGGLGEDAAADPDEHGEQRGTEAEALEHGRRVTLVDQHDRRRAEQAETHGEEADDAAGAEGDAHRVGGTVGLAGRGGDAEVGPGGEPHAGVRDEGGEGRADHEEERAADADPGACQRAAASAG